MKLKMVFRSGKQVLDDKINCNDLKSIIKIEPERFEDDFAYDQSKTSEITPKQDVWPQVSLTDILLPTLTLNRLSAKEIDELTSHQPDWSKSVGKKKKKRSVKKKPKTPKYKCQDCDEKFVLRPELLRHILKVHYEGEKFECECGKLHRYRSSFYACRSSHRSSGFSCKICDRKFTARKALLGHWKRMHFKEHGSAQIDNLICLKKDGDFTCDVCGKVLKGRRAILRHLTYQHFNPDLSCDLCPKIYKRIGDLRIHMNHVHLKVQPYHCDKCRYKTAFLTNLSHHKKRYLEVKVPKPRVSCVICKKEVVALDQHMKMVHGFHFLKCCKIFEDSKGLARHHQLKPHTGGKVRDTKKYWCDLCDREFGTFPLFQIHQKRDHPGVPLKTFKLSVVNRKGPFSCDFCGEMKIKRLPFISHMKKHPLKFGVKCKLCPFKTFSRGGLKAHKRQKHEKVFQK